MTRLLSEMGVTELHAAVRARRPLFIPAGVVECHGNHLPLGTDTIIAEAVVARVADRVDGLIAPTVEYGPTGFGVSGPDEGTIDVPAEVFYPYVKAVLAGVLGMGFTNVFVVIHHQDLRGAEAASFLLAQAALFDDLHKSLGLGWWGRGERPEPSQGVTVLPTIPLDICDRVVGDHAGRTETSLVMHLRPNAVDLDALQPGDYWYSWEAGRESKEATAAAGEHLLGLMVASVTRAVESMLPADGA